MTLFDDEVCEFLCQRITSRESRETLAWAREQVEKKIKIAVSDGNGSLHLLNMVGYRSLKHLEYLLGRPCRSRQLLSLSRDRNPFVQYYAVYLAFCSAKHAAVTAQDDGQAAMLQEKLAKVREKIERRQQQRQAYLAAKLFQYVPDEIRLLDLVLWNQETDATGKQFDLFVSTFVEHMTQRLLELALQNILFPAKK